MIFYNDKKISRKTFEKYIKPCYRIALTTSTLIILFSEMLKFSPKNSNKNSCEIEC